MSQEKVDVSTQVKTTRGVNTVMQNGQWHMPVCLTLDEFADESIATVYSS